MMILMMNDYDNNYVNSDYDDDDDDDDDDVRNGYKYYPTVIYKIILRLPKH